ncbi:MAG: hypothetical protein F6K39_39475 [Okeania sp. SIO3B3]|nr:hypothetical protein [Okeania sp. SIO3B3]
MKKEEGRRKKGKLHGDILRHATSCLQTPKKFKLRVDSRVLNSPQKI